MFRVLLDLGGVAYWGGLDICSLQLWMIGYRHVEMWWWRGCEMCWQRQGDSVDQE